MYLLTYLFVLYQIFVFDVPGLVFGLNLHDTGLFIIIPLGLPSRIIFFSGVHGKCFFRL